MTPPIWLPWFVVAFCALAACLWYCRRAPVWCLFFLGLAAIFTEEGLSRLTMWLVGNARAGSAFEQGLLDLLGSWTYYSWAPHIFTSLRTLVTAPILAWAVHAKAPADSGFVERYKRYYRALIQIARQPALDKEPAPAVVARLVGLARDALKEE